MTAESTMTRFQLCDAVHDARHGGLPLSRQQRLATAALELHLQVAELVAQRSSVMALVRPHLIHEVAKIVATRVPEQRRPSWLSRAWWIEHVGQTLRERVTQTLGELGLQADDQELVIAIEAQTLLLRDDLRAIVEAA